MNLLANPHDADLPASKVPRNLQLAGVVLFGLAIVTAAVLSLTEHWRRSTFAFGVAMIWLAVLRLTCDSRSLGVLAVRSRRFDAAFSTLLGAIMVFLAVSVDALGS
ncbi:DUF3017 domain-containing protein [Corynebacterium hindlerae]|uniref:DUF3017 domain-containing protein n=1 Tax=Corynebacterium hindlerae TaxID=699041 RepID=A0A7G5FHE6_9CORY|nr:DUF3017 domain-containing protein [Corynebacterium hindlerae]QMV86037.1 DUF3017 domain-containing protein [Corynebacterium hindlerae]